MTQSHTSNCTLTIKACIACEKNSFLNPITCYCGKELTPGIGNIVKLFLSILFQKITVLISSLSRSNKTKKLDHDGHRKLMCQLLKRSEFFNTGYTEFVRHDLYECLVTCI
jgi:hypothetical protein